MTVNLLPSCPAKAGIQYAGSIPSAPDRKFPGVLDCPLSWAMTRCWRKEAGFAPCYFEMRSFERLVPIVLNVVTIWLDEVSRKNLLESLAQFCSSVEVGEPSVLTWIV